MDKMKSKVESKLEDQKPNKKKKLKKVTLRDLTVKQAEDIKGGARIKRK